MTVIHTEDIKYINDLPGGEEQKYELRSNDMLWDRASVVLR